MASKFRIFNPKNSRLPLIIAFDQDLDVNLSNKTFFSICRYFKLKV